MLKARTIRRWYNMAMAQGWRAWLVYYAFGRAGQMLRRSALCTALGWAFTRFVEAHRASQARDGLREPSLAFHGLLWPPLTFSSALHAGSVPAGQVPRGRQPRVHQGDAQRL